MPRSNLINTLIFAIRHWQRSGNTRDYPELCANEDAPEPILTNGELDAVCEDLNLGHLHVLDVDIDAGDILKECLPLVRLAVEERDNFPEDEGPDPHALLQRMEDLFVRVGFKPEPAGGQIHDWIVTGRRHGDDEATSSHVTTVGDDCPKALFVRTVLFGGTDDANLPPKIWDDNADGEERGWYIDSVFEIAGPPLSES